MCSDSSESRKTDALEFMWLLPRKVMWLNEWYIQVESKYKEMRHATLETGARESVKKKKGGGVGKLDSTSSLHLDKDPRWAQVVRDVRLYSCWSSACWGVIRAPRAFAVLDCWRQGIAWQGSPARCLLLCIARCAKKKIFNSFTSFSRWKWFFFFWDFVWLEPSGT